MPRIAEAVLGVTAVGYDRAVVPQPAYDDRGMLVVLTQPAVVLNGSLAGRVLDPTGEPARLARVALGWTSIVTDRAGEFRIDSQRAVAANRIVAVKEGFGPAVLERVFEPEGDESGWPDYVELVLGGPTLSIAGSVVTPDGTPVPGAKVWQADPTHFDPLGRMPTTVENLSAGAKISSATFSGRARRRTSPTRSSAPTRTPASPPHSGTG